MDYYCGVWKEIKKINIFIDALTKITNNTKKINFLMLIIREQNGIFIFGEMDNSNQ